MADTETQAAPDLSQYYSAIQKADAAGDHVAAKQLADYIRAHTQSAAAVPTAQEDTSSRTARGIAEFAAGNIIKGAQEMTAPVAEGMPSLEKPLPGVQAIRAKQGKAPQQPVTPPSLMDVAKSADPRLASQIEPRNAPEKYAAAALQSLPAAVGGEGSLARRAVGAALSGVGARAGGEIAGTPGAIVGGLIGGSLVAPKAPPSTSQAAEESARSGIPLTLGQEKESLGLKFAEGVAGKGLFGQKDAYKDKVAQSQAGIAAVSKLADQISANPQNAEDLGTKLSNALTQTVQHYDQLRSADAVRDYGVVKQLAGDKPVIKYTNTVDALNKIIDETRNVPSGDSKRIYQQAMAMRDDLMLGQNPRTFKVEDAMRARRAWGQAARGTGNVFNDVDHNISRNYAGKLFGAINKDFDAASTANAPYAQALAKANKRYADYSKSIDYVRKSSLAGLVGEDVVDAAFTGARGTTKAPELMAERYMNLQPSQARQVTNILRRQAPSVLEDTKAYMLRDMLNKSISHYPGEPPMSFEKFLAQTKKMEPKLKEMGFTPKELADIRDVTNTMGRAVSKAGKPTMAGNVAQAVLTVSHPVLMFVPQTVMAKALLTPSGRALLKRAYSTTSQTVKHQAIRSLIATYTEERDRQGANASQ